MTESTNDLPSADNIDRPHRPADDREEVYFQGSPMLRGEVGRVLGFTVFGLALIALPFVARAMSTTWWPWWVILALIVIGMLVIAIPMILTRTIHYRISNYRIDYERGLFSKSIDTLELWHVEDIRFRQSFLDRILGVGTIEVISHDDTTPRLQLQSLPNPRPLFDSLKQRIISVKRQRGVIKVDTEG